MTMTGVDWQRPADLGELEALAAEARFHLKQAELLDGLAWEHRFAVGERIHSAKLVLPHGEFIPWIERELGITDRHARRLMLFWRERTRVSDLLRADPELSLRGMLELLRDVDSQTEDDGAPPVLRPVSLFDKDPEALGSILAIHARPTDRPRVIDVSYCRGGVWKGLRQQYKPVRVDIDPALRAQGFTDHQASWDALPYGPASFDVLVFDPPHITDAGADSIMAARYSSLKGTSIAAAFDPMLREALRVLAPGTGLLVAKLANQVHNRRYQDQARLFGNVAEALGFEKVDEAITHKQVPDGHWEHVEHLRRAHTYWLALRAPKVAA